ncbi:MAG: GNAT family N-acetyltransferase [Candidatus Aenigmatarchaeota archaeon]
MIRIVRLETLPSQIRDELAKQIVRLAASEARLLNLTSPKMWRLFLRGLYKQHTFVLLKDGKVIGFVNYGYNTLNFPELSYIRAIAVVKNERNNGYGKKLLRLAIANLSSPIWIVTRLENIKMQSLLRKLGFQFWFRDKDNLAFIRFD